MIADRKKVYLLPPLAEQLAYANFQRACINSSTLCYDSGVVLRLCYGEGLSRTRNKCVSLVDERAWLQISLVIMFMDYPLRG